MVQAVSYFNSVSLAIHRARAYWIRVIRDTDAAEIFSKSQTYGNE